MKIALVIPTYKPHFIYLERLCHNIAEQTRLPDLVVVRASSCDSTEVLDSLLAKPWPFSLQILRTPERQCQAENRNEGVTALPSDIDIVSFIDSDDLMHPQRLAVIESTIKQGADVVLHNYMTGGANTVPIWDTTISLRAAWDTILLQKESAIQSGNQITTREVLLTQPDHIHTPQGKAITLFRPIPMDEELEEQLCGHFGHVSILRRCLATTKFDEEALGYEDAKFVGDLATQGYRIGTLYARLSYYTLHSL